ncbi:hypothetical protein LWI29_002098 [Acer saccharum]|uniref:Uncharacterized protein n=1 Tax=Acer saccharum TaxID=4024 RepID=A0AA39S140_ACESA|nr:hypothetical protein LWI29_002098 [Acer saccharum]
MASQVLMSCFRSQAFLAVTFIAEAAKKLRILVIVDEVHECFTFCGNGSFPCVFVKREIVAGDDLCNWVIEERPGCSAYRNRYLVYFIVDGVVECRQKVHVSATAVPAYFVHRYTCRRQAPRVFPFANPYKLAPFTVTSTNVDDVWVPCPLVLAGLILSLSGSVALEVSPPSVEGVKIRSSNVQRWKR